MKPVPCEGSARTPLTRSLSALVCVAVLSARRPLQPMYERPAAPVAPSYPTGPAYKAMSGSTASPAVEIGWRDFLTDPRLQRLIEIALANNRDLRVAALNIAQAQAQYRIPRSNLVPTVARD